MDPFTRQDFLSLVQRAPAPGVSLYMPTHRTGKDLREDPIRYKNLLAEAERRLAERGLSSMQMRAMLEPAWRLQDASQRDFWEHQGDGLAMFVDAEEVRYFRLPLRFEEQVVVDDEFSIKPLVPLLEGDGRFFLLAVSQNRVRFWQGARDRMSELAPDTLPQSLAEALNVGEYIDTLQLRGFRAGFGVPEAQSLYHGHGGSTADLKKGNEIVEFFRRLNDALQEYFTSETAPLVFAGVEYLFPIFAKCSHYAGLLEKPLAGNPDLLSAAELHQRAWAMVAPIYREAQRAACAEFGARQARQTASDDLNDVVRAARDGVVEVLLLRDHAAAWGKIDEATGEIHFAADPAAGERDLLDYAAARTLANGGAVYTLSAQEMPTSQPAAVLLRYPLTWPASLR